MNDLNIELLASLYRERDALPQSQPNVHKAYWQGRIDEFVAQNAVTDAEAAQALVLATEPESSPRV